MFDLGRFYRTTVRPKLEQSWLSNAKFLLLLLVDGPSTREELMKRYAASVMVTYSPREERDLLKAVGLFDLSLKRLVHEGYIIHTNGYYDLTQKGKVKLEYLKSRLVRDVDTFSGSLPASRFSIFVNVALAVLSMAAGILSNSMGLLSSGVDNTISVFTSASAYYGIKYRLENLANFVIVLLTLVVGLAMGYEAVGRLIDPEPVDSGLLPVSVAIITGIACYLLSKYQMFVGKRSGTLSLVILSIDNINSVLICVAVLIGILFAGFGILFVDSLVSIGVAILMVKSAIDLGWQAARIYAGHEPDLSQYAVKSEKMADHRRSERFKFWTLYLLREPKTREELCDAFSLQSVAGLQYVVSRLRLDVDYSKHCNDILEELSAGGLIILQAGKYRLTPAGEQRVSEALGSKDEWMMGHRHERRYSKGDAV